MYFDFVALLHRIATAEELEARNAPYVRKYIRVSWSDNFFVACSVYISSILHHYIRS